MRTTLGITLVNWRHSFVTYLVTGLFFAAGLSNYITSAAQDAQDNQLVPVGHFLYLGPILLAILLPARHLIRLAHLGASRLGYFAGAWLTFAVPVALAVFADIVLHRTLDPYAREHFIGGFLDLFDVFGFAAHGPVVAFAQMSSLLFLLCCFLHTLTLLQGSVAGWVADALIIAIIAVFTPIAPLRAAEGWFFHQIIFQGNSAAQITTCLSLAVVVYALGLIPLRAKAL